MTKCLFLVLMMPAIFSTAARDNTAMEVQQTTRQSRVMTDEEMSALDTQQYILQPRVMCDAEYEQLFGPMLHAPVKNALRIDVTPEAIPDEIKKYQDDQRVLQKMREQGAQWAVQQHPRTYRNDELWALQKQGRAIPVKTSRPAPTDLAIPYMEIMYGALDALKYLFMAAVIYVFVKLGCVFRYDSFRLIDHIFEMLKIFGIAFIVGSVGFFRNRRQ